MVERQAELLQLFGQLGSIRQKDVTPDGGVTGANAREVSKAWPGQRKKLIGLRLLRDAIEEREGDQVRQVADGSQLVVLWAQETLARMDTMGIKPNKDGQKSIWLVVKAMPENSQN